MKNLKIALTTLLVIFAATIAFAPVITAVNVSIPTKDINLTDKGYTTLSDEVQPTGDPGGGGWPR